MNPVCPSTTTRRPARTGLGWLMQQLCRSRQCPPGVDAVFPAAERHPTGETFAAASIVGLWSLLVTLNLSLSCPCFPDTTTLRLVIGLCLWITFLHLTVVLPMLAYPVLGLIRLDPARLATLTEAALLLCLTLLAWHLTASEAPFASALGVFWIVLIMLEAMLRLGRAGIALATRSH